MIRIGVMVCIIEWIIPPLTISGHYSLENCTRRRIGDIICLFFNLWSTWSLEYPKNWDMVKC
jgi:hypothetical protein